MPIEYPMFSDCLNSNNREFCWDPFVRGSVALGLYIGAGIAILGTIILVGPIVAGSLGKWKGTGPD